MTELEKIAYAKMFIDKLANGINPIDNQPVAENDVVNNVRLTRCFFYVSDVLRQVIENGGTDVVKKKTKAPFNITWEQLSNYHYSTSPISISEIARRINELIDTERMKKVTYKQLTTWLLSIGVLAEQTDESGKTSKYPTSDGEQLGISLVLRQSLRGEYKVVVYNKDAQSFILNHLISMISEEK